MSFKIAIASGKGGTGKTSVAVNLYQHFVDNITENIQLVDCDVEEPNDLIFLSNHELEKQEHIYQLIPEIEEEKCTFCRECADYCEFNALTIIPPVKFTKVNKVLCHSCGACSIACKHGAISEVKEEIGMVTSYKSTKGKGLLEGKLEIGSAMQTMLIKELKKRVDEDNDVIIFDAPPGTSCSVVESVVDSNYVILVTEPTPFGLNDLKLTIDLMLNMNKSFGVIINKSGLGTNDTELYLESKGIELIGEIPFMQEFAQKYAQGRLCDDMPSDIINAYKNIVTNINSKILINEGNNHS